MSATREKILQTASELMEKQGYHATGLNEIIKKSRAPKGSLYYYFPDGKEQIACEAILHRGQVIEGRIHEKLGGQSDMAQALRDFLYQIANRMEETKFSTGIILAIVAMETTTQSKRINAACREAYGMLVNAFAEHLVKSGMEKTKADELAELIVAAAEGGIILSRTYHTADHLRRVADHIHRMLKFA